MSNTKVLYEHYLGCLLGGAVGDALGAPIEFDMMNDIIEYYGENGIEDYVESEDGSGAFTDDTQMTLFTAEGLLQAKANSTNNNPDVIPFLHKAYLNWLKTQYLDYNFSSKKQIKENIDNGWLINRVELYERRAPGNTCISALESGIVGTIQTPINDSKGCGGIMRVAPIGLMYYNEPVKAFKIACEASAITHGHPSGYLSSGVFASIISQLAVGVDLVFAIDESVKILKQWEGHEETLAFVNKALELTKSENSELEELPQLIEGIGGAWVGEEALGISLVCSLIFKNDYAKGVLASVNHSGDSDSTGSITGNILGLINGVKAIPEKWITNLKYADIVKKIAEDLYNDKHGE